MSKSHKIGDLGWNRYIGKFGECLSNLVLDIPVRID